MNIEEIVESRRAAVKSSLRSLSNAEVTALGESLFRYHDDPWREKFVAFVAEHPGSTYYHAMITDEVEVLYCSPEGRGLWFVRGQGLGPLQERGLKLLAEVVSGAA